MQHLLKITSEGKAENRQAIIADIKKQRELFKQAVLDPDFKIIVHTELYHM